jgi:hypothetical protein
MSRHPNKGHRNLGEFAQSVRRAVESGIPMPQASASTFGEEAVGADGGYLVPPTVLDVSNLADSRKSLLSYCTQVVADGNSVVIPVNQTPPWVTTGVAAYKNAEGAVITTGHQSKPKLETRTVRLGKIQILIPVTSELADDAPGLDAYLRMQFIEKAQFQIENWLINGDGGENLGLMNSPALLTQAKESGQSAGTAVFANAFKMHNKMYNAAKHRAVWVMHPTVLLSLQQATDALSGSVPLEYGWAEDIAAGGGGGAGAGGGGPTGAPATSVSPADGNMKLLGCPIIESEACQLIGTPGDILFVDFKNVLAACKGYGSKFDVSPYLWFDSDLLAYRFTMRLGTMCMWSAAQTEYRGSAQVSVAVALAAR